MRNAIRINLFLAFIVFHFIICNAQTAGWSKVGGKISSSWSERVDPRKPLPEYPRPQMVRDSWMNLNGLWNYSITSTGVNADVFTKNMREIESTGKILVPFAIESALSGVGRTVGKDSLLWYNRSFRIDKKIKGKNILLHFGGVDWRTDVYVNGRHVGNHEGGFDPFYFDITKFLNRSGDQQLAIRVWDPTDQGHQPRGKQVVRPEGIWYTPVTGIWQTVWLEAVPETFVSYIKSTPDIDNQSLNVAVSAINAKAGDRIKISAWDGDRKVSETETSAGENAILKISDLKLWSPESPFLYDMQVSIVRNGKETDKVKSYFAMRKSSVGTDSKGLKRMLLNNKFVFQYGPLDQGWWPDGLYTAPTDEALKFDVEKTKEMGFNMIRKHIKVEPARWYYYCDKIGVLVWQDMPSGDLGNRWDQRPAVLGLGTERKRSKESEEYYRKEWNAIIDALYPFPSIVVWIPFNEAWGQFKTVEITKWTIKKDPSRLVNSASGGNFFMWIISSTFIIILNLQCRIRTSLVNNWLWYWESLEVWDCR